MQTLMRVRVMTETKQPEWLHDLLGTVLIGTAIMTSFPVVYVYLGIWSVPALFTAGAVLLYMVFKTNA